MGKRACRPSGKLAASRQALEMSTPMLSSVILSVSLACHAGLSPAYPFGTREKTGAILLRHGPSRPARDDPPPPLRGVGLSAAPASHRSPRLAIRQARERGGRGAPCSPVALHRAASALRGADAARVQTGDIGDTLDRRHGLHVSSSRQLSPTPGEPGTSEPDPCYPNRGNLLIRRAEGADGLVHNAARCPQGPQPQPPQTARKFREKCNPCRRSKVSPMSPVAHPISHSPDRAGRWRRRAQCRTVGRGDKPEAA